MTPDAMNPQPEPGVLTRQVASVADAGLRGVAAGVGAVRAGGVGPENELGVVGDGGAPQVCVGEIGAVEAEATQVGATQVGVGEVHVWAYQVSIDEMTPSPKAYRRSGNAARDEASYLLGSKEGAGKVSASECGATEPSHIQKGSSQVGVGEVCVGEVGECQGSASQVCTRQVCTRQIATRQVGVDQNGTMSDEVAVEQKPTAGLCRRTGDATRRNSREDGARQIDANQVRSRQDGIGQVDAGADQVAIGQGATAAKRTWRARNATRGDPR